MRLVLPEIPYGSPLTAPLRQFQQELVRALVPAVANDEAAPYIHLRDPSGGVWRVAVDSAGLLYTTPVQGPVPTVPGATGHPIASLYGAFAPYTVQTYPTFAPVTLWPSAASSGLFAAPNLTAGTITLPVEGEYRITTRVLGENGGKNLDLMLLVKRGANVVLADCVAVGGQTDTAWRCLQASMIAAGQPGDTGSLGIAATGNAGVFTAAACFLDVEIVSGFTR